MALNAKQQLFVNEYLIDLNATAAYKRAGYEGEGNVATSASSRLLANVEVSAQIEEVLKERINALGINQHYVLSTIQDTIERCKQAKQVRTKTGDLVMVETPDGELAPAYTFEPGWVLKGSEMLGKYLNMFVDKIEHTGKDGKDLIPVDTSEIARKVAFMLASESAKKSKQAIS